jgi:hypothetical protein
MTKGTRGSLPGCQEFPALELVSELVGSSMSAFPSVHSSFCTYQFYTFDFE